MTTLLALYQLYFNSFLEKNPECKSTIYNISQKIKVSYQNDRDSCYEYQHLKDSLTEVLALFEACNLKACTIEFENSMNKMQRFIINYFKQFETILLYIRATRERNFLLHIESTEELIKYFFAHDHLNYARLLPLYLASMHDTKENYPDVWDEFLAGNFCVSKSLNAFTSIAPDHALEQENRRLKVNGGIIGITQNKSALARFFMIAPELKRMVADFERCFGINNGCTRKEHHEIRGNKICRITQNKEKLEKVLEQHVNPFSSTSNDLCNIVTNAVLADAASDEILKRDEIGQKLFEEFTNHRLIEGELSVWDSMKRRKISTFKCNNETAEITSGGKVIKLKEERGLLQRFVIAARSRSDLDLKECIACYEFGVIPRSLFASDGSLLLAYDKSKILHGLENMVKANESQLQENPEVAVNIILTDSHHKKVILFDGMALVNSIKKQVISKLVLISPTHLLTC